jgi:hypothetical protein
MLIHADNGMHAITKIPAIIFKNRAFLNRYWQFHTFDFSITVEDYNENNFSHSDVNSASVLRNLPFSKSLTPEF